MMKLSAIARYPVKGLSPDFLDQTALKVGEGVPLDRRFGLIHESSAVDPADPVWAEKKNFLMLDRDTKLAKLNLRYDDATQNLTILRNGKPITQGRLGDPLGHMVLSSFFTGFLKGETRSNAKLVEISGSGGFWDIHTPFISLINQASVDDLKRVAGETISPIRFRANFTIQGATAWAERDWVGKTLQIGDARLEVAEHISRCSATHVNPETGEKDLNMNAILARGYGHMEFGVYARVTQAGTIQCDDEVTVI